MKCDDKIEIKIEFADNGVIVDDGVFKNVEKYGEDNKRDDINNLIGSIITDYALDNMTLIDSFNEIANRSNKVCIGCKAEVKFKPILTNKKS